MNKRIKDWNPIRCNDNDFRTISDFLKKAKRSWRWFISEIAQQIREKQSLNLDLLLLEARKKEDSRTVNLWKEDKNYKPIKETFDFLDENEKPNRKKWWFK